MILTRLLQNVPGHRADRRRARPHPAPRGALLLRAQGKRGQDPQLRLRARRELASSWARECKASVNSKANPSQYVRAASSRTECTESTLKRLNDMKKYRS